MARGHSITQQMFTEHPCTWRLKITTVKMWIPTLVEPTHARGDIKPTDKRTTSHQVMVRVLNTIEQ